MKKAGCLRTEMISSVVNITTIADVQIRAISMLCRATTLFFLDSYNSPYYI